MEEGAPPTALPPHRAYVHRLRSRRVKGSNGGRKEGRGDGVAAAVVGKERKFENNKDESGEGKRERGRASERASERAL